MILALICIVEGVITLIALVIIPADPKNSVFLGYSLERLVLMGGVLGSEGLILLFILGASNRYWSERVDRLLRSRGVAILFLLSLYMVLGLIGVYQGNTARFLRVGPVLVYAGLVSFQVIVYQLTVFQDIEQFGEKIVSWFVRKNIFLWLTLLAAFPLLFASAIRQKFPLGFAGLYTLMAERIAAANFYLPQGVPYYGPGGIPFAYPPLGLYLMAVFLKLGISAWTYLRYAPPVFCWLALVPLFLLARRVTKSNLGGMVAAVLTAGSFYLFYSQAESGGIVRGLAFGLGLLAVFYFDQMVETFRWRDAILSGVFFGLTTLTHLGYAYYFALWFGVWVITQPKRKNWIGAVVAGAVSLVITLPWIIVMLVRYGAPVFSNAFLSHDNVKFLSLIQNLVSILALFRNNLQSLFETPWLLVLVAAGLVTLLARKKFSLPVLFLLVSIVFYEDPRFILTVSYIVAGYTISSLYRFITSGKYIKNRPLEKLISSVVVVGLFIPIYIHSFDQLSRQYPLVNQEMLDAAAFMRNNTPPQARYLDLLNSDTQEDEWLPYLTRREPVLAGWGSEWTGTYTIQGVEAVELGKCTSSQSLRCLEEWFTTTNKQPGYIIMSTGSGKLAVSLEQSLQWKDVYSNSRYLIVEHR